MLAFFYTFILCLCCLSSSFCLSSQQDPCFDSSQDNELKEIVYQIVQLRTLLVYKGIKFPLLTDFLASIRQKMIDDSIKVDESIFNRLYAEFEAYEKTAYLETWPVGEMTYER